MTQKILVTGSRETSPEMVDTLRRHLSRLIGTDVLVMAGDAGGIDYETVRFCDEHEIPVECHGAYREMRNKTWTGENIAHETSYLGRDRLMVSRLGKGDRCIAVWNGTWNKGIKGRSGTVYTARLAERAGIDTDWIWKNPPM
jgi:hypothetical protein